MSSSVRNWQTLPLESCMSSIIDYRGKTPRKTDSGIPLITAKIVKRGRIEAPTEFIDPAEYETWMRRGMPQAGDVLLTTEAPLGEVAQLDHRQVALAQRLICLRGNPQLVDNTFLKFLMQSTFVQDQLRGRATGTTVLGIKQSELRKVMLPLPPLSTQRNIGSLLGAIDEQIEINRQLNQTLEELLRKLYESWFVAFDSSVIDESSTKLVPGDTDRGPIPSGWRLGVFSDLVSSKRETVQPQEIPSNTPYIGLQHLPRRSIALDEWETADAVDSAKARFTVGNILFGKLRPYFHKVGMAVVNGVCSTDILVFEPRNQASRTLALMIASSDAFVGHATATSDGTRMPRTSWEDVSSFRVVVPPLEVQERFEAISQPLLEGIRANIFESVTLWKLRDMLLPKLLSGELVPEGLAG